ncbi:MAG: hypothetical protein EOO14_00950 [Chitinophagaceae bacterium]|nr:MAG: hypothetical protein EOO14_00950 [Chitinophagaceae bacterium]
MADNDMPVTWVKADGRCVQSKNKLQVKKLFLYFITLHLTILCSAQEKWKSIEHRNGFHLQMPPYFKIGLLVASGTLQYYDHTLDSSIVVTVETFGKGTRAALQKEYKDELQRSNVTYSVLKPNWFVASGTDDEGVFYLKTIISEGLMHHLRISYPSENKNEADKFLVKMAASFH